MPIARTSGLWAHVVTSLAAHLISVVVVVLVALLVPTDTMPGAVRAFAESQPVTTIVNAIRDLLAQQPVGTDIWTAIAWCIGILVVAYGFAMGAYHRKIG